MDKLIGVYSASVTPINLDYSINKELFLKHCNNLLDHGVNGLAVFGTTGEANSFNVEEKIDSLEYLTANNFLPQNLIPGTGHCSIADTVKLTKKCSDLKVKAVLVLPAFFYKSVSDEGVINYYRRIVEEVGDKDLKYVLYHIPQTSGVPISFEVIDKLLKLYPKNIVGIKDSSGNLDNMLKMTKFFNGFSVFSGSDSLALKVCKRGGAGAITATSNISGKLLSFIVNNFKNDNSIENFAQLQLLQEKIREVLFTHEPVSAIKAYMSLLENNEEWNQVNPPLHRIDNPKSDKTVIGLLELTRKINELIPSSS